MTRGETIAFLLLWLEAAGVLIIGTQAMALPDPTVSRLAGVALLSLLVGILGVLRCSRPSR